VKNLAGNLTILSVKFEIATGVAMPKKMRQAAGERLRRMKKKFVRITRVLPIAAASQLIFD